MSDRLPDFVGIAAVKAGSTSIHRYLGEHPEVHVSPIKETNFFAYEGQAESRFQVRSWPAYLAQFAAAGAAKAVGEFSPQYVNYPGTAERIAAAVPGARLLASLRSPADRAYSAWANSVRNGIERQSAASALRPGSRYLEHGFYRRRLEPFLERWPRDRVRIVLFEDLVSDPAGVMSGLYAFLGVDPSFVPDVSKRHNEGRFPRHRRLNHFWQALRRLQPPTYRAPAFLVRWNRRLLERSYGALPPFDAGLRARLIDFYAEEVERMERLLDRNLDVWRR